MRRLADSSVRRLAAALLLAGVLAASPAAILACGAQAPRASRSTPAANFLSLSFFNTLAGSSVRMPSGRSQQQATMKPVSSSQANSALSSADFGSTPQRSE